MEDLRPWLLSRAPPPAQAAVSAFPATWCPLQLQGLWGQKGRLASLPVGRAEAWPCWNTEGRGWAGPQATSKSPVLGQGTSKATLLSLGPDAAVSRTPQSRARGLPRRQLGARPSGSPSGGDRASRLARGLSRTLDVTRRRACQGCQRRLRPPRGTAPPVLQVGFSGGARGAAGSGSRAPPRPPSARARPPRQPRAPRPALPSGGPLPGAWRAPPPGGHQPTLPGVQPDCPRPPKEHGERAQQPRQPLAQPHGSLAGLLRGPRAAPRSQQRRLKGSSRPPLPPCPLRPPGPLRSAPPSRQRAAHPHWPRCLGRHPGTPKAIKGSARPLGAGSRPVIGGGSRYLLARAPTRSRARAHRHR